MRTLRILAPAILLISALAALLVALGLGGGANPLVLGDPGPAVRWGLPVAKLLSTLSFSVVLGTLVLAVFAFQPSKPEYARALDIAAGAAAVWTVAAGATGLLIFLDVSGLPLSNDDMFGAALAQFFGEIELGQAWLAVILIAAVTTVVLFVARRHWVVFLVMVGVFASLLPLAEQGHAAGTSGHGAAVTALGLHMASAAVWLGGLLMLALLKSTLGDRLLPVLQRYSTVALVASIVVVISGLQSAQLRVGDIDGLFTPYGALVIAKVLALTALAGYGLLQRSWVIGWMERSPGRASTLFWLLIVTELAFMGIASGVAAALGRTRTPVPEELPPYPTPAEILTGEPLPPVPEFSSFFTEWRFDILWSLLCAFLIFFYLAGVRRLRLRGDRWPALRTVSWVSGLLLLVYVTNGALNVYEKYMFSIHMLGHMSLAMMVPLLLVPGAPITLAMRAIHKRTDGSRGGREWILMIVHSKWLTLIGHPLVAAFLFSGSLWIFYFSPLFRFAATQHYGHQWMIIHFLLTGYLFAQALIGIDPGPQRVGFPLRLLLLLGTMAFHAFFGLSIMMGQGLLLADWYGAMGWPGGFDALADQQNGGAIAWGIGEIPTVVLAIIVAVQWSRADEKETRRLDRNATRTDDAELRGYNEMLERMAKRDARLEAGPGSRDPGAEAR